MVMRVTKKPVPDANGHYHLSTIPAGSQVRVCLITGGKQVIHTLAQSSIFHGVHMQVLRNDWGRIIVSVADRRIALNRDVAYKVLVYPMNSPDTPSGQEGQGGMG